MTVIIYAGNAADRNERGQRGALSLGRRIADEWGIEPRLAGRPAPLVEGGWRTQLDAASENLRLLSSVIEEEMKAGRPTILTASRCAASVATLPRVAEQRPDTAIVWFDAHGDSNVPAGHPDGESAYLGGMVLSGAAGEWETGFGGTLHLANVILVGSRDLDPPEQARIDSGQIALVAPGPDIGPRLRQAIGGRSAYVHLDCDVLDGGLLATEYQVPNGLSFAELREAFDVLADHDLIGLEIAEYEDCWADGSPCGADALLVAVRPALDRLTAHAP